MLLIFVLVSILLIFVDVSILLIFVDASTIDMSYRNISNTPQEKFLTQLEYVTMIKRGHATSQSHDIQENISLTDSEVKMPKMYNIMVRNCIK